MGRPIQLYAGLSMSGLNSEIKNIQFFMFRSKIQFFLYKLENCTCHLIKILNVNT